MVRNMLLSSPRQLARLATTASNVNRWGPDDELGTLNYITKDVRRSAVGLVQEAAIVALGKDLVFERSRHRPPSAVHFMIANDPLGISSGDAFLLNPHGYEMTHLDAVGHSFLAGKAWNGRSAHDISRPTGLTFGSILATGEGIVTRGVLLDVAAARGRPYLDRGEGIGVADLEAAEELTGTTVNKGDAVFVRSGLDRREAIEGPMDDMREGVLPEVIEWLHGREVAIFSGDCIERLPSDVAGFPLPLHQIGMVRMGLHLLDNPNVERLAEACAQYGRSEFLLVIAPLRIPGGTASPVNPLAIF